MQEYGTVWRIQQRALDDLQEEVDACIVNSLAIHTKSVTITPKDMHLAHLLREEVE